MSPAAPSRPLSSPPSRSARRLAVATASPSSPPAPLFGQLLLGVGRQWRRLLDLELARLGLTDASWVPLFHLCAGGDGISLKELAHRVGLDSSTLVRIIDLLEARGLLRRDTDPRDRRSKLLFVTAEGRDTFSDMRAHLADAEQVLLQGLDPATVRAMHAGLQQLAHLLQSTALPSEDAQVAPQGGGL